MEFLLDPLVLFEANDILLRCQANGMAAVGLLMGSVHENTIHIHSLLQLSMVGSSEDVMVDVEFLQSRLELGKFLLSLVDIYLSRSRLSLDKQVRPHFVPVGIYTRENNLKIPCQIASFLNMVRFCHAFPSLEHAAALPLQLQNCTLTEESSIITSPAQYTIISWNVVAKVLSHLDSFENKRTLALNANSAKTNKKKRMALKKESEKLMKICGLVQDRFVSNSENLTIHETQSLVYLAHQESSKKIQHVTEKISLLQMASESIKTLERLLEVSLTLRANAKSTAMTEDLGSSSRQHSEGEVENDDDDDDDDDNDNDHADEH